MGVRGLTTYIAKNSKQYLENYELFNSYIVIDGNNIASQLYKWHCVRNDCFGGDYDKYAQLVNHFFKLLEDCNVIPIIVFDGGYEDKKLKTVFGRLKNKVKVAKHLNSVTQGSVSMFPLFMRDLFVDIVLKLELKAVRCDFEADYEMACIARSLNCPVLSYDSDFYIFDVLYIPFSSFTMSTHKVKNSNPPSFRIRCQLYNIDNFLKTYGGFSRTNLPLIATLLGNDYINKSVFKNFYNHIKIGKRKHVRSDQQRKIVSVMKWMQNETYESAVRKILGRLKTEERTKVAQQIKLVTEGYMCKKSEYLRYLNITLKDDVSSSEFNFDTMKILNDANIEAENSSDDLDDEVNSTDSESDSESSDSDPEIIDVQTEVSCEDKPNWFIDNFRKCQYPPAFMDILTRNMYFCTPQLEDYSNICSHHISASILAAINKILSSGDIETLTYVARSEKVKIRNYSTPSCDINLPKLEGLKDVSPDYSKNILLEVLNIDYKNIEFVNDLPVSWQLYIVGIIYWIRNAKPKVAYCHVYSLILCMLVINQIDPQIGYCRTSSKFANRFEKQLLNPKEEEKKNNENDKTNFIKLLGNITYNDSLFCMKELVKYFQIEEKMTTHLKLFDIQVLDCYAQFQSCLLHIEYLNKLLNKPFCGFLISDFYDGTFIYNMCINLTKRNDVDAYLNLLLKNSTTVLTCFKKIVEMLMNVLSEDVTVKAGKRRRRKKKKNNNEVDIDDVICKEEHGSEDEDVMDINNRFSLLNLIK